MHFVLLLLPLMISFSVWASTPFKKDDPELDRKLTESLNRGAEDEKLALDAIRNLSRSSMTDTLMQKIKLLNVTDLRGEGYFLTLLALSHDDSSKKTEILDLLSKKVDITNMRVSSPLRISFLQSLFSDRRIPVPETLVKLLEDNSFDMRLRVMDIASGEVQKNPLKYEAFLKKALVSSPYLLRLKAVESVEKMSIEQRKRFQVDIKKCVQNDQSAVVKLACGQIQF